MSAYQDHRPTAGQGIQRMAKIAAVIYRPHSMVIGSSLERLLHVAYTNRASIQRRSHFSRRELLVNLKSTRWHGNEPGLAFLGRGKIKHVAARHRTRLGVRNEATVLHSYGLRTLSNPKSDQWPNAACANLTAACETYSTITMVTLDDGRDLLWKPD